MKYVIFIAGILCLVGCKTKTIYVPVKQTSVETVKLRDTIIEVRLEYYRDTVITPDTISFLANPYGFSWAETKEGKLHHSLTSWKDSLFRLKTYYIEKTRIDSIPAPYAVEVPVNITKSLSWWEKVRMRIGEVFLIGLGVGTIYLLIKRKRLA